METIDTIRARATRRCGNCCEIRPLIDFRRIRTGEDLRHTICNECRNRQERDKTRLRQLKTANAYSRRVNELAAEKSYRQIVALTSEMIRYFNGLDGFATAWKNALNDAARHGRYATNCRGILAIANLACTCSALEQAPTGVQLVEDEDIERRLEGEIAQLLMEYPELAIRAAHQLGWRVIPPDNRSDPL